MQSAEVPQKMDKMDIYNGVYSAIKKTEIMSFAERWMELEIIMLSEISQTEKDKYHLFSLTLGIQYTK
jgi:hypothetical protein